MSLPIKHNNFQSQLQIFHIYELSITSLCSRAQCAPPPSPPIHRIWAPSQVGLRVMICTHKIGFVFTFTMTRTGLKVHCWGWIGIGGCVSLINKNQRPNKRQSRNRKHQNLVLMNKQELSWAKPNSINQ